MPELGVRNVSLLYYTFMLQAFLIGNLGADAEVVTTDGGKFVKFRVADTEQWKDVNGNRQSRTSWVDCTMNCPDGQTPPVLPFLLRGTMVSVFGSVTTRVYSSKVDRCMKAGLTLRVSRLDLLGGRSDLIPRQLFTTDGATMYDVQKFYHVDGKWPTEGATLVDRHSVMFNVDSNGWVTPSQPAAEKSDGDEVF